jgi:hypothetical protein
VMNELRACYSLLLLFLLLHHHRHRRRRCHCNLLYVCVFEARKTENFIHAATNCAAATTAAKIYTAFNDFPYKFFYNFSFSRFHLYHYRHTLVVRSSYCMLT